MSKVRRLMLATLHVALATLAIAFLAQTPGAAGSAGPAARDPGARRSLEGTWRVTITPASCATGENVGVPFHAMASFALGGTVTTADGSMNPSLRGTGLGHWWHATGGSFGAVIEAFLYGGGGAATERQRLTQEIEVTPDGEEFTAIVRVEVLPLVGQGGPVFCATSVGHRQ